MKARDSFDAAPARVPGHVRKVALYLAIEEDEEEPPGVIYTGTYEFDIPDDSNGSPDFRSGAVKPHLSTAQKTALKNLMDQVLALAQAAGS